jgi:BlaI family penicillinase repressor
MKRIPRISESEWTVMEVVWTSAPVTAAEIIEQLGKPMKWKHQTIRTLLARLVKKGALSPEAEGNRYLYRPLFTRDECVGVESDSFLKRMFGGATQPLLVHFASRGELTREELAELKRILNQKGSK